VIELREDQQQVIDALRELPLRQRNALVLRYYEELGIDDIASTMGISRNSVKTHLRRGLSALEARLGDAGDLAESAGLVTDDQEVPA
jgi:RNA polymerase sigma factor (sigma-70 family)